MTQKVLIVDDDRELRSVLRDLLQAEGYAILEAGDGLEAGLVFRSDPPDAVLLDLKMPRRGGLETLIDLREADPDVPVIMLTAHADLSTAVQAVKQGAYDFTAKPPDYDLLLITIRKALATRRLEREVRRVTTALESSLENSFGPSPAIGKVIAMMIQVAQTDLAVVIHGETGTGKSHVASAIHALSRRSARPFVRLDVSAIPETLVESELFGARKGSYTGSERDREGFFASARGGTVLLDDIENMTAPVQAKILDVIENKRVVPVGHGEAVALDFRLIAATNRDLRALVAEQRFREDLFYRLGEFLITLPPLRERPEDIRFFMDRFLQEAAAEFGKPLRGFTDDAAGHLLAHRWPGNVRELKHVVRRAALLCSGALIDRESISLLVETPERQAEGGDGLSLKDAVREVERTLVTRALERTTGNKTQAAKLLGISYPNMLAKVKEFGGS